MPQTVYFENTLKGKKETEVSRDIYSKHKKIVFCLRDKASYDFVLKNKFISNPDNCLFIPDMVLGLEFSLESATRNGVLLCFRSDREKIMSYEDKKPIKKYLWSKGIKTTFTSTVYLHNISRQKRHDELNAKLKEYSGAKLVITDRLHSMLFAAITGTPCIAFDNKTGKVKGVLKDKTS